MGIDRTPLGLAHTPQGTPGAGTAEPSPSRRPPQPPHPPPHSAASAEGTPAADASSAYKESHRGPRPAHRPADDATVPPNAEGELVNQAPSPATDPCDAHDDVDRLVHAWRRERPDLDVSPLEVLSRVTRLARHLDRARRQVFVSHDLESWEFDVLTALRRAGTPYELSPGRLLAQTLVTSGTMTNRIDRLADKGLVARRRDPNDRRGVLVRLTTRGRERVDAALTGLLEHERSLLSGLSSHDRARLADLLRDLTARFDDPSPHE